MPKMCFLVVALTVLVSGSVGASDFRSAPEYPTIYLPYAIAAADFNSDGHLDIAVTSDNLAQVAVMFNSGNGEFLTQTLLDVSGRSRAIAALQLNADPYPDLVIGSVSGILTHYTNDGAGSFVNRTDISLNSSIRAIAAGDFNGDTLVDVAVGTDHYSPLLEEYGTVSILLNNGLGSFSTSSEFACGAQPEEIDVGDIDGDADLDLITSMGSDRTGILFNQGDGAFSLPTIHNAGGTTAALADMNLDGHLDLLMKYQGGTTINCRLNNGSGIFEYHTALPASKYIAEMVTADLDEDGYPDVIGTNSDHNGVDVLTSNLDGTFARSLFGAGYSTQGICVADFNGDTFPDAVVAAIFSSSVCFLRNLGDGRLAGRRDEPVATGVRSIAPIQIGVDSAMDAAYATVHDIGLVTNSPGGWAEFTEINLDPISPVLLAANPFQLAQQDLFVAGNQFSSTIVFKLPNIGGSLSSVPETLFFLSEDYPNAFAVADFNNDSYLDFAVGTNTNTTQRISELYLALGTSSGPLPPVSMFREQGEFFELASGDVDNDGVCDLLAANSSRVLVFTDLANDLFAPPREYPVGTGSLEALVLAHLNQDAALDVATVDYSSDSLTVLMNDGTGIYTTTQSLAVGNRPTSLAALDFDGDGDIDLASANNYGQSISLVKNDGTGLMSWDSNITTTGRPDHIVAIEWDNEGNKDLWVGANIGLSYFQNRHGFSTSVLPTPNGPTLRAYPNPFNPSTRLQFALTKSGPVEVALFDVRGRFATFLYRGPFLAGDHILNLNTNELSIKLASGIYFVRLSSTVGESSTRITLIK